MVLQEGMDRARMNEIAILFLIESCIRNIRGK